MKQVTTGNLTDEERAWSAIGGASLALIAIRRLPAVGGVLCGVAALGLFARAVAGYCGVKAAVARESSLVGGVGEQWRRVWEGQTPRGAKVAATDAVDAAVEDSFPASDPPASHIPDEVPVNAEEKWAANPAKRSSDSE